MSDRTALERYKARITLYIDDVQGADPADPDGMLGLYPVDQQGTQGARRPAPASPRSAATMPAGVTARSYRGR